MDKVLAMSEDQKKVVEWKPNPAFLAACESLGLDDERPPSPPPPPAAAAAEPAADEPPAPPAPKPKTAVEAFGGYGATSAEETALAATVARARCEKAEGGAALARGDGAGAIARYGAALAALEATDATARKVLLGRRFLKGGRAGDGTTSLAADAAASRAMTADITLNLAAARLGLGDAAGALGAADAYLKLEADDHSGGDDGKRARAHFRAARALEKLDRLADADARLRNALALVPDDAAVRAALGRVRAARVAKRKAVPKASFRGVFG